MIARISTYKKAEEELLQLDAAVRGRFYDFCHRFRQNPDHAGLDLKPLKGDGRVFRAKLNQSYRVLLAQTGVDERKVQNWVILAVRHRKHVYEELSIAINRITGGIEFIDFAVVGESVIQRAGLRLTPAEQDDTVPRPEPEPVQKAEPLLDGVTADDLRDLGVAEQVIDLSLAVTESLELDALVAGAPELSKDVLYGLASGMGIEEVREEITAPVQVELGEGYQQDLDAALARSTVTTHDDDVRSALEEGSFRDWKVYLHGTQHKLVKRGFSGPARVSGGPGTGKTIAALHRVKHLAERLREGHDKPILLTTFTKNLAVDLRARLASLMDPALLTRVDIAHIDQLAARVLNENKGPGKPKTRIKNSAALTILRELLAELDEKRWAADFLFEEWEHVILGQSLSTRKAYFEARRAGRGRSLTRPERAQVWKLLEQFTARLDKGFYETWGQAAERAARFEMERDAKLRESPEAHEGGGGRGRSAVDDSSGMRYRNHRYSHLVIDEGQDLRAAHWKMLRAMVRPGPDDMFIAADTYQRIYDQRVTLGAVGVHIRGRSAKLTLSYRSTQEILTSAVRVVNPDAEKPVYDDLDDGNESLTGYRSLLRGPAPEFVACDSWDDELAQLSVVLKGWREDIATNGESAGRRRDPSGNIAVCVADHGMVSQVMHHLTTKADISVAELTKDGPKGSGEVHVGTMHRFKGLEYQKLAIVGVRNGVIPRTAVIDGYRQTDPQRYAREELKARSLLFMAATRARDVLRISWYGEPSPYLPL